VFVSGNPGSTNRLQTTAQLQTLRDLVIPHQQLQRSELRGRLIRFSQESAEKKRIATDPLFGVENSYKNFYGRMRFLADPAFFERKRRAEAEVQQRIASRRGQIAGDPWREIAEVQDDYAELYLPFTYVENGGGGSTLYGYARTLVRAAQERAKPADQRLPEFAETRLPLIERNLLAERPGRAAAGEALSVLLAQARPASTSPPTTLTPGCCWAVTAPRVWPSAWSPAAALADRAERERLWKGGLAAVPGQQDPYDPICAAHRGPRRGASSEWETRVQGPTDRAAEQVAKAQFLAYGEAVYPDATFSPRLSYGKVEGWTERGRRIAPVHLHQGPVRPRHGPGALPGCAPLALRPHPGERRHRVQPHLHQRHHRRQLRLAPDQCAGRGDRRGVRRQPGLAWRCLLLRPGRKPVRDGFDSRHHGGAPHRLRPAPARRRTDGRPTRRPLMPNAW
jgi:hypothetical protein